jgi:hypothetical protein
MSLAGGWTADGWVYSVYWNDPWFQVVFTDGRKEVWRLLKVEVVQERGVYVVKVSGKPLKPPIERADFRKVLIAFAEQLGRDLEAKGSGIIRGRKLKPYGDTELLWGRNTPRVPTIAAKLLMREREAAMRELARPAPALPRAREVYGLGSEGMRRLRVLFESTLYGLGIKPTAELRVKAEEVIYHLESKYKDAPRDEAMEKAINELLKWIEGNIYFKKV